MSREFRDFVLKGGLVDLEEKLIRGGGAATRARFSAAREANLALPKRRQNSNMQRRLKRAETYLGKRGKRGTGGKRMAGGKNRYSPLHQRPRTLPQAREWAKERLLRAQNAHAATITGAHSGATDIARRQRRAARYDRIHDAAQRALSTWERTKRPPPGFRRGK